MKGEFVLVLALFLFDVALVTHVLSMIKGL
jgi:hypothetical protein